MQDRALYVCLTVDTDEDAFDPDFRVDGPLWEGLNSGVPLFLDALERVFDQLDARPPVTWFVRADLEVERLAGSATYVIEQYASLWQRLSAAGDEIGFHPHIFDQLDEIIEDGVVNSSALSERLRTAHFAFAKHFHASSSRIGKALGWSELPELLLELGYLVDSSAMPGRYRQDRNRLVDWRGTPQAPYKPRKSDYRLPGGTSRLIEVPMSMMPTLADYDSRPLRRYVDFTYHPEIFAQGASTLMASDLVVSVLHPSELVPAARRHGLLSFSVESFETNLRRFAQMVHDAGRSLEFVKMADVPALIESGEVSIA